MKKKPSGLPSEAGQKEERGQSTPQAWAKNESEGGFSSDSSVELAPSLKVNKPAQPRQSIPGFRRNRSWQEPEPRPEVQRVLNSLTSFRSAMVASQKQMLQLLDDELERLNTGPSLSQGLRAAVRNKDFNACLSRGGLFIIGRVLASPVPRCSSCSCAKRTQEPNKHHQRGLVTAFLVSTQVLGESQRYRLSRAVE